MVAVRGDVDDEGSKGRLLADGVISMFDSTFGERLPDGTLVQARSATGDTVMLSFSSPRGDRHVYMDGVLRNDTLAGRWRSEVGRSSGSGGTFVMTRRR